MCAGPKKGTQLFSPGRAPKRGRSSFRREERRVPNGTKRAVSRRATNASVTSECLPAGFDPGSVVRIRIGFIKKREPPLQIGRCDPWSSRGAWCLVCQLSSDGILLHGSTTVPPAAVPLGHAAGLSSGGCVSPHRCQPFFRLSNCLGMVHNRQRVIMAKPTVCRPLYLARHCPGGVNVGHGNGR